MSDKEALVLNEKLEKLILDLEALKGLGDPEYSHERADALLLEFIGNKQVYDAFDAIDKWYA